MCRIYVGKSGRMDWKYLVFNGFGKNEKQIRKRICETGMKQYVKILGEKRESISIYQGV